MPIVKDCGRQDVLAADIDFDFSDLVNGTAVGVIDLPIGAIVTGGFLATLVALDSGTSDVIVVKGVAGDALSGSVNVHALGCTALTPSGALTATNGNVTVTWTGVGAAPSAGKCRLVVNYIVDGRSHHSHG
ncbi:hypothetical protein [Chrysiogenes arsenatis]|uniref:hypothetical protein n=1 Tax=Chrysiogenes arsenatis TaxID=309797 RepID=UPI000426CE1A|nr:hypothetical protein [Chrysiogenes arsenatis]